MQLSFNKIMTFADVESLDCQIYELINMLRNY